MRPCRTAPLLIGVLGVLLAVTGCVAVPGAPPTGPARPPASLAPADDRPPAPLDGAWPSPTQAPPRQSLEDTAPSSASTPEQPAPRPVPPAKTKGPQKAHKKTSKKILKSTPKTPRKSPPKTPSKKPPRKPSQKAATPRPADMRELCREAHRIRLPHGIPALCRDAYGR
ncbi:hypothetical protein ACFY7C_20660 [Streptomyces sp. NPDC012769]|uniref:hypothetical protein n=1 Tax=Streptomyces sp. NPDC012769 TaxID=3364848 RepID=UPI0036AC0263